MAASSSRRQWGTEDDFSSGSSSSDEDNLPIGGRANANRFSAATSAGFSLGGARSNGAAKPSPVLSNQASSVFSMYTGGTDDHVASNGDWSSAQEGAAFSARHAAHEWGSEDSDSDGGVESFDRAVQAHTGLSSAEAAAGVAVRPRSRAASEVSETSGPAEGSVGGIRTLLSTPVQQGAEATQFYVTRTKHILGHPTWSVFLEQNDQFLCSAKKRSGKSSSNYLITLDADHSERKSRMNIGKLRANLVGSMYIVYDAGLAPDKALTESSRRRELAAVAFDYDRMGPGRMSAYVPPVQGMRSEEHRPQEESESLSAAHTGHGPMAGRALVLHTKQPQWDDKLQGHVLNFRGRVTQASVKNFQLQCERTGSKTVLQFGRVDKNRFSMDVAWPLSPLQAIGIVLASLDPKIADTKSYDALKKQMKGGASDRSSSARQSESSDEEAAAGRRPPRPYSGQAARHK